MIDTFEWSCYTHLILESFCEEGFARRRKQKNTGVEKTLLQGLFLRGVGPFKEVILMFSPFVLWKCDSIFKNSL